jgi:hypothetical protein
MRASERNRLVWLAEDIQRRAVQLRGGDEPAATSTIEREATTMLAILNGDQVRMTSKSFPGYREDKRTLTLLQEAQTCLADIADKAGDVSEWNEGGEYYEVSHAIRTFLNENKETVR